MKEAGLLAAIILGLIQWEEESFLHGRLCPLLRAGI